MKNHRPVVFRLLSFSSANVFACFALSPKAQAVSPAPDGGYPGCQYCRRNQGASKPHQRRCNTAVGLFSLFSEQHALAASTRANRRGDAPFSTADENTAIGAAALLSNTTGHDNTANGAFAFFSNTDWRTSTPPTVFQRYLTTPPATTTRPTEYSGAF